MSRTISANLEIHVAEEATTLATLWKVTRVDSVVFGFTDHDQDIVYLGLTYSASTSYRRSAMRANLGLEVDDMEIQGAFDSAAITEADLLAGLWDYATVEQFTINWSDTSQGVIIGPKGRLGEVSVNRNSFNVELRSLSQALQQPVGRLYMPACDADLGDARCAFNLPSLQVSGTITGISNRRIFFDTSRAEATGYFDQGKITWTSGNNSGFSAEVKYFLVTGGQIDLQMSLPYDVQVGDGYTMTPGCNKTFATCISKFSNGVNFQGFPHIPGLDRMLSGGRT